MPLVSCTSPLEITFWAWDREFPELHLCSCAYHLVWISLIFLFPVPVTSSCSTTDIGSFDLKPFFIFFICLLSKEQLLCNLELPRLSLLPLPLFDIYHGFSTRGLMIYLMYSPSECKPRATNPVSRAAPDTQQIAVEQKGEEHVSSSTSDLVLGTFWNSVVCFLEVSLFLFLLHCWELELPNSNTDLALWGASFCGCLLRWHK